jgi:hypothetical protein
MIPVRAASFRTKDAAAVALRQASFGFGKYPEAVRFFLKFALFRSGREGVRFGLLGLGH